MQFNLAFKEHGIIERQTQKELNKVNTAIKRCLTFVTEPQDVADAVLFLASDDSRKMTGQEITVDGGWDVKGGLCNRRRHARRRRLMGVGNRDRLMRVTRAIHFRSKH